MLDTRNAGEADMLVEEEALSRRGLLQRLAIGAAGGVAVATIADPAEAAKRRRRRKCKPAKAAKPKPAPAAEPRDILAEAGAGMYNDASTAHQVSGFTINRNMVSCAVAPGSGPSGSNSDAFSMLMYAVTLDSYVADKRDGSIRAAGRMRSITRMGGNVTEDALHRFAAIALTEMDGRPPRFDVHFITPFWDPATNKMATPSTEYPGWSRFGGELLEGVVRI